MKDLLYSKSIFFFKQFSICLCNIPVIQKKCNLLQTLYNNTKYAINNKITHI